MKIYIIIAILLAPCAIYGGFVTMKLWDWFIVPLGMPEISLAHAIGLGLLVSYLTMAVNQEDNRDPNEICVRAIFWSIYKPSVALLIGFITHHFMP